MSEAGTQHDSARPVAPDAAVASAERLVSAARPGRRSVRTRLMGIVIVGAVLAVVVGVAGLNGVASVNSAQNADLRVTDVQTELAHVEADRSEMGAAVLETIVSHLPAARIPAGDAPQEFTAAADMLRSDFAAAVAYGLPGSLQGDLWAQWTHLDRFVEAGQGIIAIARADRDGAASQLNAFDATAEQSRATLGQFSKRLEQASLAAERTAARAEASARYEIGAISLAAVALLMGMALAFGRSIVRALRAVSATATSITAGDLNARTTVVGDDEIGSLGRALNEMADSQRGLFTQLADEARRDSFRSQLSEAFEIADTVPDAYAQVAIAMRQVASDLPMELLLADSSQASMDQKALHPTAGGPGCPVQTPYECVAVRRGTAAVFESSETLNACPKLRGRAAGPVSAACIPVTFMGRALGVLHATGPEHNPPTPQQVAQLTALAAQAGSTIGTVRSTESTTRQATTDGLTGLVNRRVLENEMRRLLQTGRDFAIAMADLDHFKAINDTYGHEAGDRALRLFSQVTQAHIRADDIVGRYGGEEFVFLFPDQSIATADETLERLRAELASAHTDGRSPRFTASYGLTDSSAGSTIDELLRVADDALARAKSSGRDRIVVSDHIAANR